MKGGDTWSGQQGGHKSRNRGTHICTIMHALTPMFFPTTQTYCPTYLGIIEPLTLGLGTEGSISHFFPRKFLFDVAHATNLDIVCAHVHVHDVISFPA